MATPNGEAKPKKQSRKPRQRDKGSLVPQPHGGAIMRGGNWGNKGGGRPPNKLRQELRDILDEGFLSELRRRISPKEIKKISHQDLARYIDTLGKYGIGTKTELSGPDDGPLSHGVLLIPGKAVTEAEDDSEEGDEAPSA